MFDDITCEQKAWQFIRALNEHDERLDAIAIADVDRNYTYRQLFRWQERYAEVFSALGITEEGGSRVGVVCSQSVITVFSFFALNMLGVSMSAISPDDIFVAKWILRAVAVEGITDLVLPDTVVRPPVLHEILRRRTELGLRHVIVVETSHQTPCPTANARAMLARNLWQLRAMPGVLFMSDLLARYAATPIAYGSGTTDEAAIIVHSSGTTKGTHKPIPLSDVALNTAAARLLTDDRFAPMRPGIVAYWSLPIWLSTGFVSIVYTSLAFGVTLRLAHGLMDYLVLPDIVFDCERYGVGIMFALYKMLEDALTDPRSEGLDLSGLKMVVFGGGMTSADQMDRARELIRAHGGNPKLLNGYGLSECGAANTLGVYDEVYHGIGRPLEGVSALIRDEETGEFNTIDATPHVGTLYLSSPSNSCGRLGEVVLFELEQIDGKSYVCTNDLVRTDEEGDLFFVGRANRFFVSNDGLRFEEGVVENALAAQEGIAACAIVGAFEKVLTHDTVPVLYVAVSHGAGDAVEVVRKALRSAYVGDTAVAGNALPWMCVIADELPVASSGKVDVTAIKVRGVRGREFTVVPVDLAGKLVDVTLVPAKEGTAGTGDLMPIGMPHQRRQDMLEQMTAMQRALGPDFLRVLMESAPPAAFSVSGDAKPQAPGASFGGLPQMPIGPGAFPVMRCGY